MLNPARLLACVILASPPAWAALPFAVASVKYQVADTGYSAEATVEAVRQSTVSAQVSGRVAAVNFDAGDYVKAGTVIVRLSAQELSSAVAGSQAQVAQAAANLANARANYERQQQLFQQKFISQAALDTKSPTIQNLEAWFEIVPTMNAIRIRTEFADEPVGEPTAVAALAEAPAAMAGRPCR
ncbi:MAG: biotin/lipoyl-binding protein [Candidatus Thermoplasmatota archaeon]|nr:biotin/lipoyl-binding protein [Candidatus Thermoplasmatota archaeon]